MGDGRMPERADCGGDRERRARQRPRAAPVHAAARRSCSARWCCDRRRDRSAIAIDEGTSIAYAVRLDARHGHDARRDPAPSDTVGRVLQVAARAARHRYALLRPGDGRGVLRLRAAQRPARRARRTQKMTDSYTGPLHRLRLRPRRPAGGPRPARGRRADRRRSTRTRAPRAARPRTASTLHRAAPRLTTRCCSQAGIERAAAVIACVDSDAENIFIALSARELRDGHADHRPRVARGRPRRS